MSAFVNARNLHYKQRHQASCKVTFPNGEIIQMESNQEEANMFTCRCGKDFNGAQNIQKHGKRYKFIPGAWAVDEDEHMTTGDDFEVDGIPTIDTTFYPSSSNFLSAEFQQRISL
ncbi:unnamed protein product [Umbelopsis vinacea]